MVVLGRGVVGLVVGVPVVLGRGVPKVRSRVGTPIGFVAQREYGSTSALNDSTSGTPLTTSGWTPIVNLLPEGAGKWKVQLSRVGSVWFSISSISAGGNH